MHGSATIHTIHSLAYQGVHDAGAMVITGPGPEHCHSSEFQHFGTFNLTKAALYRSTLLTTVNRRPGPGPDKEPGHGPTRDPNAKGARGLPLAPSGEP